MFTYHIILHNSSLKNYRRNPITLCLHIKLTTKETQEQLRALANKRILTTEKKER